MSAHFLLRGGGVRTSVHYSFPRHALTKLQLQNVNPEHDTIDWRPPMTPGGPQHPHDEDFPNFRGASGDEVLSGENSPSKGKATLQQRAACRGNARNEARGLLLNEMWSVRKSPAKDREILGGEPRRAVEWNIIDQLRKSQKKTFRRPLLKMRRQGMTAINPTGTI